MHILFVMILLFLQADDDFFYLDDDGYHLGDLVLADIPRTSHVSWTPDGQHLTYFVDNVLVVVNADTHQAAYIEPTDLQTPISAPRWSKDGRSFVVEDVTLQLVQVTVNEVFQVVETEIIYEGSTSFPQWSPDGKRVAFVSNDDPSYVYVYDGVLHSHRVDRLFSFRAYWWDDEHIAFVREDGVYTINLADDSIELLYETGYNPLPARNHWQFSPDRTRLIFDGVLYDISGDEIQRLGDIDGITAWSPDSQHFLMTVSHLGGTCVPRDSGFGHICYSTVTLDVVVHNRDGAHVAEVAQDVGIARFGWRP